MDLSVILGLDVGGQSIKAALYPLQEEDLSQTAIWEERFPTAKGVAAHALQIAQLIEQGQQAAQIKNAQLVGSGIGTPGRFGENGLIKPGTNPNVGTQVHEFDGVCLRSHYQQELQKFPSVKALPFEVQNDGNAMLAGMIHAVQHAREGQFCDHLGESLLLQSLAGKTVGLIGLGTGLGHAIAQFDTTGQHYHFVTDGHASKLRIPVDAADISHFLKAGEVLSTQTGRKEIIVFPDGSVRAEDLCRSPMVNALADVECGTHINIESSHRHMKAIELAGKYIGRIMAVVHSGENEDIEPENGWSAEEKQQAAQTSIYLFGGGLGVSPLGVELMEYAQQELDKKGVQGIRMAQIDAGNVASYAAALMMLNAMEE